MKGLFDRKIHIDRDRVPVHIAIIPDGNGRWAKKRGMPRAYGHRAGSNKLKEIVRLSSELGIKYLTLYAFSTENWSRPKDEVNALMELLVEYLGNAERELDGTGIRLLVIGERQELSPELQSEIERVEGITRCNTGLVLILALNYGGRREIVNAIRSIIDGVKAGKAGYDNPDEKILEENLYTYGIPEPDLIIRTSGEQRLSNFLLWQTAYSEFIFPDVLWPDFGSKDFIKAISEYQHRKRRFGGI
jgi:undecaprenyl diphosphate synthase